MGHGSDRSRDPWRRVSCGSWIKGHRSDGSRVRQKPRPMAPSIVWVMDQGSWVRWVTGQTEAETHGAECRVGHGSRVMGQMGHGLDRSRDPWRRVSCGSWVKGHGLDGSWVREKPRPMAPSIAGHWRFDSGGALKISPFMTLNRFTTNTRRAFNSLTSPTNYLFTHLQISWKYQHTSLCSASSYRLST